MCVYVCICVQMYMWYKCMCAPLHILSAEPNDYGIIAARLEPYLLVGQTRASTR